LKINENLPLFRGIVSKETREWTDGEIYFRTGFVQM
jgi:hypothetical protein